MLYKLINNYEQTDDEVSNYKFRSLNKFLIVLVLVNLVYFLPALLFFKMNCILTTHIIQIVYWVALLAVRKKHYILSINIKLYILFSFLIMLNIIAIFEIQTKGIDGMQWYSFPVLTALPFFFNFKTEKKYFYILFVYTVIIFTIVLYALSGELKLPFMTEKMYCIKETSQVVEQIKLFNFISCIIIIMVVIFFISEKDRAIFQILAEKRNVEEELIKVEKKYKNIVKSQFKINELSSDELEEIHYLAEANSPIYIERFCILFPDFKENLMDTNPILSYFDFKFCSYIKLGYDVKKIAQISNITVRAAESRKYRIKKKMMITDTENLDDFIKNL